MSLSALSLSSSWRNCEYDDKRGYDQSGRNNCYQSNTSTARRKFTPDDPILTFKIAVEPNQKNHQGDPNERRSERFADVPQAL